MRIQFFLAATLGVALSGCNNGGGGGGNGGGNAIVIPDVDVPDNLALRAETVLPPGQSGHFSAEGQAQGSLSGTPSDYGAHVDDQRALYWQFDAKPGALGAKPGAPHVPIEGVEIYRDGHGVPIVYAATVHDVWFGVGYAVAQDRLFLMDAVRRTGAGTLAELTGCGTVPADVQQRVLTYSDAEYAAMYERLSPDSKDMVQGYVDGANARLDEVLSDPSLMPAEYALLSSQPEPFTVKDVLAAGVYITRFVAAEGGNEFLNIRMLRALQTRFGPAEGLKAFQDLVWLEDGKAVTTVPADATFSNQPLPAAGRDAVLADMVARALALPETIWKGEGTGHAAAPAECQLLGLKTDGVPRGRKLTREQKRLLAQTHRMLAALHEKPRGASFAFAVGPQRTRDGGTLLISAPQLGYAYPSLLVEFEVHGAGFDGRGVSVPILPTVGIGYTPEVAWALTTGYSKTIDSFIERVCSNAEVAAATCSANQYFHKGAWRDLTCRTETVSFRAAPQGLPGGPSVFSTDVEVCRSVHGPLVARDNEAGLARSVQYAMFGREIETIEGIRRWNTAKSFAEFLEGVRLVTWNENVTVATRDGHIAFFHPGLFPARAANTDMRFPVPGTGEFDFGPSLAFEQLPRAIDPAQGFLFNWNTKPALGWLDGEGMGATSRPGGPGQRGTNLRDILAAGTTWSFADLRTIDRDAGTRDPRAREYLPVIASFRTTAAGSLTEVQRAALDLVLAWDRRHYDLGIDIADASAQDSAGATVFDYYVRALRDELFGALQDDVLDDPASQTCGRAAVPQTVYSRVAGVGSHLFDQSVMDNVVLRVLDPATSSLAIRHDWAGGRPRDAVMAAALAVALQRLEADFGMAPAAGNLAQFRRVHPRSYLGSLTDVIGPGSTTPSGECVTMPYQDRGSWVHRVGYELP